MYSFIYCANTQQESISHEEQGNCVSFLFQHPNSSKFAKKLWVWLNLQSFSFLAKKQESSLFVEPVWTMKYFHPR